MRQRLLLHVGLPKTGTTFVQRILAEHRDALREHGFVYPFVRPEGMFHAAVEIRSQHARWGLPPELVDGTWVALLDRARAAGGTAVISSEILGAAEASQVRAALQAAAEFDVHLVVTARDLARQVPAHWQEQVKNGQSYSFAELAGEVVDPHRSTRVDSFWREQDLLDVLDRWAGSLAPDHVHVVVCPPSGSPVDVLWERFCAAIDLDPGVVSLDPRDEPNRSLDAAQVALLRAVNERLGGRLPWPDYARVVKRYFAQQVLTSTSSGTPARTPRSLESSLAATTDRWVRALESRRYDVHGDLADLVPRDFADDGEDPDDVAAEAIGEQTPALVAALLERVAELRRAEASAGTTDHPTTLSRSSRSSRSSRLSRLRRRRGPGSTPPGGPSSAG